ncbi:hypothetical protein HDU76_004309 [Blyttiomyces sp. JEL0837]|nr:hypothetical protein HDU76_004309 [Blyttiomyces sp. JEL0837]
MGNVSSMVLAPTLGLDLAVNTVGFIVSAALVTEKYYDMVGTSTFITCSIFTLARTLLNHPGQLPHARQLVMLATTSVWATRLFLFLSSRVHTLKGDRRFDKIKDKPVRFGIAWFIQSIWIATVGYPTFRVLAMEPALVPALGITDFLGLGLWAVGFAFETIADMQKLAWQKKHGDDRFKKFIDTGLWSLCRYPNYFGEITLWFGSYFIGCGAFPGSVSAKYGFAASPLLTTFLLTRLSGIPLQEKQAKERFKDSPEYKMYKSTTSLLVPWFKKTKSQ